MTDWISRGKTVTDINRRFGAEVAELSALILLYLDLVPAIVSRAHVRASLPADNGDDYRAAFRWTMLREIVRRRLEELSDLPASEPFQAIAEQALRNQRLLSLVLADAEDALLQIPFRIRRAVSKHVDEALSVQEGQMPLPQNGSATYPHSSDDLKTADDVKRAYASHLSQAPLHVAQLLKRLPQKYESDLAAWIDDLELLSMPSEGGQ